MRKKSAALLIALLIISAIAILAFTAGRSTVAGIAKTSNTANAMVADQAAIAGLERGLLYFKADSPESKKCRICNDLTSTTCQTSWADDAPCTLFQSVIPDTSIPSPDKIYVGIRITKVRTMAADGVHIKEITGYVESVGYFGRVFKRHRYCIGTTEIPTLNDSSSPCP